jgi:hypothetical protein
MARARQSNVHGIMPCSEALEVLVILGIHLLENTAPGRNCMQDPRIHCCLVQVHVRPCTSPLY